MSKPLQPAVAYLRTSSAANVGADKDSDKRQRAAIEAFAKHARFTIVDEYYDAAVSGADPVDQGPGFAEMLQRLAAMVRKRSWWNLLIGLRRPCRAARRP
jgi:DNA invertase Pin-like site-specific DNA recombinase